ncbi:ankyrin 3 [Fusarium agapanthi]|uniref:Ankyrin 3 n=1 Tax=Fusarium agapanthi TaxID=1803897 RepID=A0A9P5EH07_9HYPO|nr:ankyrin 3 [Fusarium agapanthi]
MSFTSPTEQFNGYQALSSGSSSSKTTAQSFSPRVDFSDQSYDMPYFADPDVSVSNPQTVSTASKQSVAGVPWGFTPKQLSDALKTKSFDKKRLSSITNTSKQAQPSQPLKAKIDYTEFLESLEFPSFADNKINQGSGDLSKSQWLVQEALFTKWTTSNGLLWLRGSEGSGKSTLMKQALESCQGPSSIHLTYSFSPSGDEARTRLSLFKSLLRQLVPHAPEAFKGIKERFDKIQTHSVFIYVDGLNYSEGETAPKLVQDFSKLVEKSQILTKDPTTTHGLKIIFSSMPYPMKDPFPRTCIQVDEKHGPSLRKRLEGQLSNIDLNTQRLISTKAGSSFISARLIVNHVKLFGPGQSSLVQQPSPTPAPISFLLGVYFQDMAHQGSNGLLSLFKWCCLSSRPLGLPELRVALALDAPPKVVSIKELSQMEYLTRLDFFISKGLGILSYKAQAVGATASPIHQAHHSIATCLLRYLAILSKEPRWESMARTEPALRLVGYAASWSYHITSAGLGKPEASKLLKVLGWPSDQTLSVLINAPYQKPANPVSAAKPPMPQVIRKPVGGKPATQAAAEKPTQQSSFLPWQQPQAPVPTQAQVDTTQSLPSKPHARVQAPTSRPQAPPSTTQSTPGKNQGASGPVPYLSNKAPASTGTSQPAPTKGQVHPVTAQAPPGMLQAQGGMPPRKPQAAPGVVQPQLIKPQVPAQAHHPSGKTAPVPFKSQAPPGATQPQVAKPQAKPQAQTGKPAPVPPKSQTPTTAVQPQTAKPQAQNGKAEPQTHKMQGPPGTSQIPSGKLQDQGGLPSQKPQVSTAKPSVQSGTSAQKQSSFIASAKPSATPTQAQKSTPDQRKPIPSYTGSGPGGAKSPTSIPVQGSSGQEPHQYIDQNSMISPVPHYPEPFYRGQYGEQTQASTFTSTREFTNSNDPNTQQMGTSSMFSGKIATVAGVGVLAGAAGGYFLSSEIREDHSNPSITDDNSYIHMDVGTNQQSAYDSDGELETHVEFSDHSEEFSESENEANSINDSDSDGFLSDEEYELSDSEVSVGQASSDDEISEWGESDAESVHEDSDSDELDLDNPYMSADFTDSEASETEDLDARDLQAESGSDLGTDPGQASAGEDSESDEIESVSNESGDELDESVQSMGFQQQSYTNQQYQQQGDLNEQYQQPIPEEPEYEEHVQPNFQPQYQQQGYFNGQYQQQVAQQSDSDEDEPQGFHHQYQQQGYYNQHNQVAEQTESQEDEPQNFQAQQQQQHQGYYISHPQNQVPEQSESEEEQYQQQYQQQGYHSGQHQQQANQQYDSEDEEGQQVAQGSVYYDSDQEVESDQEVNNGYSSDDQGQQASR